MTDSNNESLTSQQIHKLGVDFALNAASSHNDEIFIVTTPRDEKKFYINTDYGLREVIFCCSTSKKNGDKINNNISRREFQNRFVDAGKYTDKFYILVHMNFDNGINRYFKVSHPDLCMLQYERDCHRNNHHDMSITEWFNYGKGRNNIECDLLAQKGCEVWK